jgi:hypothetical protein
MPFQSLPLQITELLIKEPKLLTSNDNLINILQAIFCSKVINAAFCTTFKVSKLLAGKSALKMLVKLTSGNVFLVMLFIVPSSLFPVNQEV